MKKIDDAPVIARRISEFLYEYAPQFLTNSENTLKGYSDALTLYFQFLEESGVTPYNLDRHHLEKDWIEKWILWLKKSRKNSPETCNNRLASLRRFLEYLAGKDIKIRSSSPFQEPHIHVLQSLCRQYQGLQALSLSRLLKKIITFSQVENTCET